MKSFRMRAVSLTLAVLLLGALGAGCSGNKKTSSSEPAKPVTIRYARWGLPEEMNGTKKILAAFQKENPNITVKLENSSWDQYWQKMQTEMASSTAPDAMLMDGGWYLTQFAPNGALEDIGALMKKSNLSKDDFFNVWTTFTYNNKIYALPRDYNSIVLFYNKDLFKKAGITEYPNGNMTWQQLVPIAQKLTLDKNGKNATDPSFDASNIKQYGLCLPMMNVDSTLETVIWQNGGQLMSTDGKTCLIDSAQAKGALQFIHDLTFKYHVAPSNSALTKYGEEEFPSGSFAMVYQGSWLTSSLSDAKFDWDISVAPTMGKKIYCAQSVGNAILSSSTHKDAAWKLVQFMSGKEGQTIMAQSNDSIPVLKEVAQDYYVKQSGKPANKQAIFDEAANTVPYVSYAGKSDIFDAVTQISAPYFDNRQSLDATVSSIMAKVKSIQALNQ